VQPDLYGVLPTEKKDRLTVLKGLQNEQELQFLLNPLTYDLLETFQIPKKPEVFKVVPQEKFSDLDFNTLLDNHLPKLGSQQRTRVMDAAAIAFTTIKPIGQWCKPLCDDAPQFKLLTLSWLCVGYMKGDTTKVESCGGLSSKALDKFLKSFWDYYHWRTRMPQAMKPHRNCGLNFGTFSPPKVVMRS